MKVRFNWFTADFDKKNNFLLDALLLHFENVSVTSSRFANCDIEFIAVTKPLPHQHVARANRIYSNVPHGQADISLLYPTAFHPKTWNSERRIWYGVENLRPPFQDDIDAALSFEQDPLGGYNAYFPPWYELSGLQKPFLNRRVGVTIWAPNLLKERSLIRTKKKFACAFLGKPDQTRFWAIKELSRIGQVDVFGPLVGRPIPNKREIAKEYKFMLCFENDLYPGYVSEKPLEAYLSETVPLYWGDLGSDDSINRLSLINLREFENMEQWISAIQNLTESEYSQIYRQPFLKSLPNLSGIYRILTNT